MAAVVRRMALGFLVLLILGTAVRGLAIYCPLPRLVHDPLVYFPTLFLAVPGLVIALALYRRNGISLRFLLTGLVVLGINVAADIRLPLRPPIDPPGELVLQLLSYNIFQARWGDDDILALVRERHPDILFMQEVPTRFFETHERELRQTFRHVTYENQLLAATNLDVVQSECLYLSAWRSVLHLTVDVHGKHIDIYNTHLSVANPKNFFGRLRAQQQQTDEVLAHLKMAPGPILIAGDFNFPLHSTCYRRVTATYQNARAAVGAWFGYTFNTWLPVTAIDHCFASPEVQFLRWEPLPVRLSDHRPVLVRFALAQP